MESVEKSVEKEKKNNKVLLFEFQSNITIVKWGYWYLFYLKSFWNLDLKAWYRKKRHRTRESGRAITLYPAPGLNVPDGRICPMWNYSIQKDQAQDLIKLFYQTPNLIPPFFY